MKKILLASTISLGSVFMTPAHALPSDFVYLDNVDPTIILDMRYVTPNNFMGRPVKGYDDAVCILTKPTADALKNVQAELKKQGLTLRVYDCYRPQMAVEDFIQWSQDIHDQKMKKDYYPNVNKADFFKLGYVAEKSGHTRGSTVDLTIDGLEMGTHFDFMDVLSHNDNKDISKTAYENRMLLKNIMIKYGFTPYPKEWWHFTLKNEPYPDTYFDFPVKKY